MKLEGIREAWAPYREEGYDVVRKALAWFQRPDDTPEKPEQPEK